MACFSTFNMNSMTSHLEQSDAQSTTYILFCSTLLHLDEGGGQHSPPNPSALSAAISLGMHQPTPFLTFTITSGKEVFHFFVTSTKKVTSNLKKNLLEIEVIKKFIN